MTSPASTIEAIEKAMEGKNRIQGMVRSIDHYRNGVPKAVADGSYAQVLYALTDYKHDVLVLWDFAVSKAREVEALERENAELTRATQESLVAMRIAACLPNVAAEYDFSDALGYCERALAPHARAPRRI